MDLDHILTWLSAIGAASLLVQCWRMRFRPRGWTAIGAATVALLLTGWLLWPQSAGLVAGGFWLLSCVLPAGGKLLEQRLLIAERYGAALWTARLAALLHPFDAWWRSTRYTQVLGWIQGGRAGKARRLLAEGPALEPALGRFTRALLLRHERRWEELVHWVENGGERGRILADPRLAAIHLRALGELGRTDEMLACYGGLAAAGAHRMHGAGMLFFLAAFTGKLEMLEELLRGPLARLPGARKAYWRASALQAQGRRWEAEALLEEAAARAGADLREEVRERLQRPLARFEPDLLIPPLRSVYEHLESALDALPRLGLVQLPARFGAALTWVLMGAIALAFLPQLFGAPGIPGGPEEYDWLTRWGMLVLPLGTAETDWYRFFSACFLHAGAIHLLLNLTGLWYLGSYLERVWGHAVLALAYLGSGIGANLLAPFLIHATAKHEVFIVGASGALMGLLGTLMILILREALKRRSKELFRQAQLFVAILVLQVVFDYFTPQVSSEVHLAGLAIGIAGALLAWGVRRLAPGGEWGRISPS